MNSLTIIGNLTRDPETRTTKSGKTVCSFTVAVNRWVRQGEDSQADYFRVSAWEKLGENCQQYLAKGRKVAVTGTVSVTTYQTQQGDTRANLEVMARDVEFLSPKAESAAGGSATNDGWQLEDEDLPF